MTMLGLFEKQQEARVVGVTVGAIRLAWVSYA